MIDSPANRKTVEKMAKELQAELDKQKDLIAKSSLIRGATIKIAFEHFKRLNSTKHWKTIKDYNRFFDLFKQTFDEDGPCSTINKLSAEEWLISIRKINKAQNTIFGYFKQFRHFYNFLFEYNYIPMFKLNKDVTPKAEVKDIIVFSANDVQKIFDGLKDKNLNFKAMIYLAYYSGLRSSDLLSLSVDKINLEGGCFNYYAKKIKKWRQVSFHKALLDIFKELIEVKKEGKLLNYNNVENMNKAFTSYLTALELRGNGYSMRTFRKTFITNASKNMDLATVSNLVGHQQINTTARYYTKIDLARQKGQLDKLEEIESAD